MTVRRYALPLAVLVATGVLLMVQLAQGGRHFVATPPFDPCGARGYVPLRPQVEATVERVVYVGLDQTACKLGISRERLILALASPSDRHALERSLGITDSALIVQLRAGLLRAVDKLERDKTLPKVSAMLPSIYRYGGLPPATRALLQRLPAGFVDGLLPTAAVVRRALGAIDVRALLDNIGDGAALEQTLRNALVTGALEEARSKLPPQWRKLLPQP